MSSKDNRPVNLDLRTIQQPLPAITSILHRISGLLIFIGLAFLLYYLDLSLSSKEGFAQLQEILANSFIVKLIIWGVVSALLYHLVAGIKHLIMDLGYGETLEGGRTGARIVLVISIILILLTGYWIW